MNSPDPVRPQPIPSAPAVMYQNWRRLLFLHWTWDPAGVQATLPRGLTVDTWDGRAWLGIVPFKMERVRPRFLPAVPAISNFPELNVRTYVKDATGRPGVWFYSLDCAQRLAVWGARLGFGLPYFHAMMQERTEERVIYDCRRRGASATAHYEYRGLGDPTRAGKGTIEEFLIERYRLFSTHGGRLMTGLVWHEPYPIEAANVGKWSGLPLLQAGFGIGSRPPEHAAFSAGVDVSVHPLA